MSKAFFVDVTLCTACRGCQVACKQWHDLPAEATVNTGTYQNPPDLSFSTYKLVRMNEEIINGKLNWLFFPDQCRHCIDAPCLETAMDPDAIYQDPATGAILYTIKTKGLDADEIIDSCPYNIPRKAADGTLAKCDMCNDRVHNGLKPACVNTCPTGAMNFGDRDEMLDLARKRLAMVKKKFPKASLLDPDDVNVIYLVAQDPGLYAEYAVAGVNRGGISRSVAMRKMMGPFARLMKV
ncbi:4Fe-4S dicluster domain-containing protein [Desulfospira joergensenii]|uniref:4Fe-4S dicluster domain-containing protein n=1 Tax=Desulfospira joergensenii TaxID=53329 RepID=UPI0003B78E96|nr:4Fe-4S dicluster domain-containing protein [Desulfospira joergensenii]